MTRQTNIITSTLADTIERFPLNLRTQPEAEHFRLIFEHAGDAILLLDPVNDRIVDANPASSRLLGYTRDELLALRISDIHGHELAALVVFTQSVLERGSAWTNELSCRVKGGGQLPVEISATSANLADRQYLIAIMRDSAHQKYLHDRAEANSLLRRGIAEWRRIENIFQEIERDNKLILKAAGEGIYGVDADGVTTFVNPAAARILGWRAEDLVGRTMHGLIHHSHADGLPYPENECPIYAAFRDGAVHHVDAEVFWRKDGSSFPVEYTSTPIVDRGQLIGAVIVFRDISDRKETEAQLRSALAEVNRLKKRLELENAYLQEEIWAEHNHREIVGRSRAISDVIRQIELVAPTGASVLITGESGTGKELIARAIHQSSRRCDRSLIRVNCAAIPHDLFESEFFGHIKGAFTGALKDRAGRFELADGGTLFLDEVGEIPLELQGKLLRVLQEAQFERVGEDRTRQVDVRVIAATNRDLKDEVTQKRFREDLYFRLNVFPIELAPLRQRLEDVPVLAAHFLKRASAKFNSPEIRLTRGDIARLQHYDWPGNIRELQNVIERAVIVSQQGRLRLELPEPEIRPHDADAKAGERNNPGEDAKILSEAELRALERDNTLAALNAAGGKLFGRHGAAEILGIKPTTLASRIKRLGIRLTDT